MKKTLILPLLLVAGLAAESAQAGLALSNTGQPTFGGTEVGLPLTGPFTWVAREFTAGEDWTLTGIDMLMIRNENSIDGGGFFVQLWSDAGNAPGAALASFAGTDRPWPAAENIPEIFSFTGSYALSAGTSYWLLAGVTSGANSRYPWAFTLDSSPDDAASRPGWSVSTLQGASVDLGATWNVYRTSGVKEQFALSGTAGTSVPVPATPLLMLFGLAGLAWRIGKGSEGPTS